MGLISIFVIQKVLKMKLCLFKYKKSL